MKRIKHYTLTPVILLSFFFISSQNLKSPSDFLGYPLGTQFSRHHQVVDYFKYVAATMPNQVTLEKYGETYERRPLYVSYISSEENIKNLENIRQNNLKNVGVLDGNPSSTDVAIVWLSYNVHGDEASSIEASMKTIYTLLTEKQEWLKNTVVIIDPCINPDGRDRYANWFNETASQPYDINQQASEHHEPWPGGRPNHYLFDLNRDWVWATQIETSSRLKIYNQWLPHIHVDFHEQGINEPYYFAPAAEPFHEIISDWQRDFQTQIGKNHIKYFDKEGWLYFTRERFDLLYPSYGDTYPTFLGAIGMTYEQAGQGRAGLGIKNDEDFVLTLIDRINHHTTTGLSTVEIASKNIEKINTEFKTFFDNSNLKYKSYVLKGNKDQIGSLKNLLDKHEINYYNTSNASLKGFIYSKKSQGTFVSTESDLVVSTNQPKGKMVKVLFEPNTKLSDSLTYDSTAWSLPYACGLEAIALTTLIPAKVVLSDNVLSSPNAMATAYVVKWNHLNDAKFLSDLLKKNVKVRFSEKSFTTFEPNRNFEKGTLIITRGDNKQLTDFDTIITDSANSFGRITTPVMSGFSQSGPDFGSPDVKLITKKKIALLSGEYTNSENYGALWHFFEQQLHYPVTSINTMQWDDLNLDGFDVLIVPDGDYKSILDEKGLSKLESWIKKGGSVIAVEGALKSFVDKKAFNLKAIKEKDSLKEKNMIPYASREREDIKNLITGAIFKTHIDETHPLAFGYNRTYFTLKRNPDTYELLEEGYNVGYFNENPENFSGFAGSKALIKLKKSLVFGEEHIGKGNIIYMVDDVMFRSFWENGKLFLVNAIFFTNNYR